MTLRLILTRHAKSSWDNAALSDEERTLNSRGQASATAIGGWLASRGYIPDQVLCSDAVRTRETWAYISVTLEDAPEADLMPDLYLSGEEQMLEVLQQATGTCVMMIAHNPGSAFLAEALAFNPPDDGDFQRYPTAATTIFEFEVESWDQVTWKSGNVIDFIVPRDLVD